VIRKTTHPLKPWRGYIRRRPPESPVKLLVSPLRTGNPRAHKRVGDQPEWNKRSTDRDGDFQAGTMVSVRGSFEEVNCSYRRSTDRRKTRVNRPGSSLRALRRGESTDRPLRHAIAGGGRKRRRRPALILLDVRTLPSGSFAAGHVEVRQNISAGEITCSACRFPRERATSRNCQSSASVDMATRLLSAKGFDVVNLSARYTRIQTRELNGPLGSRTEEIVQR